MRRSVLMLGLASLAAAVLQLPSSAQPGQVASSTFTLDGEPCSLIPVAPVGSAAPVGVGSCPGVRPGARVQTPLGLCTFNFLFRAPDGQRYMGTAGHCVLAAGPIGPGDVGERTWAPGEGPVAADSDGNRIGEFVYAVLAQPKDFALIRLDRNAAANPQMCHFGGPTGLYDGLSPDPVVLQFFGSGIAVGTVLPARSAVAFGIPHPDRVRAAGVALPGDSGSGVISSDGRAVGVLVTVGLHGIGFTENGVDAGTIGITRLVPQVTRAQEVLGTTLELVTG